MQGKWRKPNEKLMKRDEPEMEDDLRTEYDLKHLRVRKLGSGRKSFGGVTVRLEPDVAEAFPDSKSVNDSLRALASIIQVRSKALATN